MKTLFWEDAMPHFSQGVDWVGFTGPGVQKSGRHILARPVFSPVSNNRRRCWKIIANKGRFLRISFGVDTFPGFPTVSLN